MINKIYIFDEKRNNIINEINLCFNNTIKNNYILVTNLYEKRWDIEVYFKTLKSNFKMSNLRITNKKQTRKINKYN